MRPREKLLLSGVQSLSDPELLAIFLRCGTKNRNVIELSSDLLEECGGIRALLQCQLNDLSRFKGLGIAKWSQLQAIYELVKRSISEELKQVVVINSPAMVREYLQASIGHLQHEVFGVLFLDALGRLIEFKVLFRGTINQTTIYPKEVVKEAIQLNASALIISHNHPVGEVHPSQADIDLTNQLQQIMHLLDISLLDHCIVSPNGYFSFLDAGLLNSLN
ncbi:DNA replication and repair protein RadC [Polynucleobacter kasalickyi]|uniref:DNA replication and repair protein RadC n=2 Tax=Polynucleobacter kasalickyi TaxID=1938817 RepID=A0A1W1YH73_9BURK|nr:DNA replication and repair protein RadC [Polynucleobacter kasalickyi]